MTEILFQNADQLRDALGIQSAEQKNIYKGYTPLTDHNVGFSVTREYPSDIRFKSPITKNGTPDKVAIIHVIYSAGRDSSNINKIPIRLIIGTFSRYLAKHIDYDFVDPNCPTKDSVQLSKTSPEPLSLEDFTEYSYDHSKNGVCDSKGRIVSGKEMLDGIFQKHCNTVHRIKGLIIQSKLGSRNIFIKLLTISIELLKWILKTFFGRTFESEEMLAGILKQYKREDMRLLQMESLEIFNFKASKNVAVTFSALVLIIFLPLHYFHFHIKLFTTITTNHLLTLTTCILSLWFLDVLMPLFIFRFINLLIKWKLKMQLWSFKI